MKKGSVFDSRCSLKILNVLCASRGAVLSNRQSKHKFRTIYFAALSRFIYLPFITQWLVLNSRNRPYVDVSDWFYKVLFGNISFGRDSNYCINRLRGLDSMRVLFRRQQSEVAVNTVLHYRAVCCPITGSAVALHCVKAHRQSRWRSPNFNPL